MKSSIILGSSTAASTASAAGLWNTVINTKSGPVQGVQEYTSAPPLPLPNWQSITAWKGIRYAAPAVADNRFRAPQPIVPWTETFNATSFGWACPENDRSTDAQYNEDCLTINIWTSAASTDEKRPVIFWSYPGGGQSSNPSYGGSGLASKGAVFVNYNYRTGPFGYLAHPELSDERLAESRSISNGNWDESDLVAGLDSLEGLNARSSGNYGLLDQFAALKWTKENIAAFGGDPNRIMAVGESAGSAAVYHLVNGPFSKGMLSAAIAESGIRDPHDPLAASLAENYKTMEYRLQEGVDYLKDRNVTSIKDLRALPWSELLVPMSMGPPGVPGLGSGGGPGKGAKGGKGRKDKSDSSTSSTVTIKPSNRSWAWGTTLDYYAVPDTYIKTLESGPANDVPLITGNNKDESGSQPGLSITVEQYQGAMQTLYGSIFAPRFLALYPASNAEEAAAAYNLHYRDTSLVSSWLYGKKWARKSRSPIYTYLWDHAPPGAGTISAHMSEIPYCLNNLHALPDKAWTEEDQRIAGRMSDYWVNFATTGNPNEGPFAASLPARWEPSVESKMETMHVGDGWGSMPLASKDKVDLISEFFASQKPF